MSVFHSFGKRSCKLNLSEAIKCQSRTSDKTLYLKLLQREFFVGVWRQIGRGSWCFMCVDEIYSNICSFNCFWCTSLGPFWGNEHFPFVFFTELILFQYFHLVKMNYLIKSAIQEAQDWERFKTSWWKSCHLLLRFSLEEESYLG